MHNIVNHPVQIELENSKKALLDFAYRLTENKEDANDLYQDTAIRILTHRNKFELGTNFKAWAITIMRHSFINNYRKEVRRRGLIKDPKGSIVMHKASKNDFNKGEGNLAFDELSGMVDTLPEELKTPFLMMYQGFKYHEIAEALKAPLGTIKSRVFFARKKLQKLYFQANRINFAS